MKMMRTALACALLTFGAGSASAATQVINFFGLLTGARGVLVGGKPYNVEFVTGSCTTVFKGCAAAAFAFHDKTLAAAAAQALLDQVFVNTAKGAFDDKPNLTAGCGDVDACVAMIPYQPVNPGVGHEGTPPNIDFGLFFGANNGSTTPGYFDASSGNVLAPNVPYGAPKMKGWIYARFTPALPIFIPKKAAKPRQG